MSAHSLPTVNVTIKVKRFEYTYPNPAVVDHEIRVKQPWEHANVRQGRRPLHVVDDDNDWIHVLNQGAVLRFQIVSGVQGESFQPLGMRFIRSDIGPQHPEWIPSNPGGSKFPFSGLRIISPDIIEVTDTLPMTRPAPALGKIYKFSVEVRRMSDNLVGIIDPYFHNET